MKTSAKCFTSLISYSWIYITYCFCLYKRGNELSWESGSWTPLGWLVRSQGQGFSTQSPCAVGTSQAWSFIQGGTFLCVIPGSSLLPPERSWIHCGPREVQAEPLGLPGPVHCGDTCSTQWVCPQALPLPWAEKGAGGAPELAEPLFSPGAGVPQPASIRYCSDAPRGICSPTALAPLPSPAGAEPGWGNRRRRLGLYRTLGLSVTYSLSWGRTLYSLCQDHVWFACPLSCEWGWSNRPTLTLPRGTSLVAAAHWRQAWVTSSVSDVRGQPRGRDLGSEALKTNFGAKAKHFSFPWWILLLNFAWIYWMSFKTRKAICRTFLQMM